MNKAVSPDKAVILLWHTIAPTHHRLAGGPLLYASLGVYTLPVVEKISLENYARVCVTFYVLFRKVVYPV